MKIIKLFLVSAFFIFASTAQADDHIGPAFRLDPAGGCVAVLGSSSYHGDGIAQYSNGNTGHATWKCKLKLTAGDPTTFFTEFEGDVIGSDGCWNTVSVEGKKGMWTAQCFGAWTDG